MGKSGLSNRAAKTELLQRRLNDQKFLEKMKLEAARASNVTKPHQQTKNRVLLQWKKVGSAPTLVRLWERTLAPSTTVSYTNVLLGLRPELREELKTHVDRVRQLAGNRPGKQAIPITVADLTRVVQTWPPAALRTLLVLFLSACRHGDLKKLTIFREVDKGVWHMKWNTQKSDRYGQRRISKFIEVHPRLRGLVRQALPWTPYRELLRRLKDINPQLTVHSLRRGAATLLASYGFSMSEIGVMTGHAPTADPSLAVRRYVDPHFSQPESQLQRRQSLALQRWMESSGGP